MKAKTRIMYIEDKSSDLSGPARIGRVTLSKTGRTVYYRGRAYQRCRGYKYNHFELGTGARFWISGCRRDGTDRLYDERIPVEIDDDVREEYWTVIRGRPDRVGDARA